MSALFHFVAFACVGASLSCLHISTMSRKTDFHKCRRYKAGSELLLLIAAICFFFGFIV